MGAYHKIQLAAVKNRRSSPYLFDMFNIHSYYGSAGWGLNRILNLLVDALNERPHLPKILVMVPDKDIIANLKDKQTHTGIVMGGVIHYIIKQINTMIKRRVSALTEKKPGMVTSSHPKIVWIRMLKCSASDYEGSINKNIFPVRGKFNSILEQCILEDDDDIHRIMSILVDAENYDAWGNLTDSGKEQFWLEVDKGLMKFNMDEISLRARNFQNFQT